MKKKYFINEEYVKKFIKARPADMHKGQCGRVLVAAGSKGMAGAAVLAAGASLKSGAGLVQAAVPDELFPVLQSALPQATCISQTTGITSEVLALSGAVAIGPGLGIGREKYSLVKRILEMYDGTVVLDADGLNNMCRFDKGLESLKNRVSPLILTPHPGEGDRLLEALGEKNLKCNDREAAAEYISLQTGAVVLLKGAGTVVKASEDDIYINTTGNPGMATGGSGDVLTGVIAALAAYGLPAADAAKAGAFIHGLAGDIAAEKIGQWGMTSLDIQMALPGAFKLIAGK